MAFMPLAESDGFKRGNFDLPLAPIVKNLFDKRGGAAVVDYANGESAVCG